MDAKLAPRRREDKEHAISQKLNVAVAVIGSTHNGVSNLTRMPVPVDPTIPLQ